MKIAAIIDCYTVAVNRGAQHGVEPGDKLAIGRNEIHDPETGEHLGFYGEVQLRVTDVYPRFAMAKTDGSTKDGLRITTVNIGDAVERAQ